MTADLLIICGDFQGLRSCSDLEALAVPAKYRKMNSFARYYRGEAEAHCLTLLVGGNHEASNALGALYYGGWLAPRIYYMGAAGCVRFRGLRIAGLSGIYNERHYTWHHFETRAKTVDARSAIRSAYHVREIDVFRLSQLGRPDVFVSHDWPRGIERHGNLVALLKQKPYFRADVERNDLGSPAAELLLQILKPRRWFAAHLHCRFSARVEHNDQSVTDFLALDKCLPRRDFLQLVTFNVPTAGNHQLEYDPQWLAILEHTHGLDSCLPPPQVVRLPSAYPSVDPRRVSAFESVNLIIPTDFQFLPVVRIYAHNPLSEANPQTDAFLAKLGLPHTVTLPSSQDAMARHGRNPEQVATVDGDGYAPVDDPNEIYLADDGYDDSGYTRHAPTPLATVDDPNQIDLDDDDESSERHVESPSPSAPRCA